MSKLVVLYNYNKYYNRIIKRKSTFQEYVDLITPVGDTPAAFKGFIRENLNFDYQDGVYAMHVINILNADPEFAKVEHPDYCVLEETYVQGEGDEAITTKKVSRYFILDVTKIRGNQWRLSLRRDLLADYYSEVLNAPVFIEKGNLTSLDDPAIFNKESMTFNQIKKGEYLLNKNKYSGRGQGWIVGYLASEETPTDLGPCVGIAEIPESLPNYEDLPTNVKNIITAGVFYEYALKNCKLEIHSIDSGNNLFSLGMHFYSDDDYSAYLLSEAWDVSRMIKAKVDPWYNNNIWESLELALENVYVAAQYQLNIPYHFNVLFNDNFTAYEDTLNLKNNYNGYTYVKDGKIYKIVIERTGSRIWSADFTKAQIENNINTVAAAIHGYINRLATTYPSLFELRNSDASRFAASIYNDLLIYSVRVEQVAYNEVKTTISEHRNKNLDAPYDIFCIPLGEVNVKSGNTTILTTTANTALPIARAIATVGTASRVYDIQVLPYCPFEEILNSDGDIDINGFDEHFDYDYIVNTVSGVSSNISIVIYPKSCRGTFDFSIPTTDALAYGYCSEDRSSILSKKIKSETQFVRFVSPNFASSFEINVQKNKGIIDLNVDYFLKPYSPYIHIAPYFKGLYGQDFNDPKALICSGDFSISTSSSKWEEYQIQNKNYELIFNRQIANLDVNNSIAYQQAAISSGINVATSALVGVGAGAVAGRKFGSLFGPVGTAVGIAAGAVVGGIAAGVTSGAGRKYDLEYLKQQQSEARSYSVDMYAYNLQTIQALPYSLTKVTALSENNKIFPFLEFYDCTEEEKEALRNKLQYNGFTIMRIGNIKNYIETPNMPYVSGQLIRLVGIDEDSHVVAEIAKEIKEGAYYYGSNSE